MKNYLLLFAALLVSAQPLLVLGQNGLPRGLSPEERWLVERGNIVPGEVIDGAMTYRHPMSPPRSIAEWEELQGLAITWTQYPEILTEIVRHSVREVTVYIVHRNEAQVRQFLNSRGVDPDSNIVYLRSDFNSVWIRDYGPNSAYTSDVDSLVFVDWIYNRPRPKDDVVPGVIADTLNALVYSTTMAPNDLVNTGGNYMADGMGRGFSSDLVLDENGPGNIWGMSDHDEESVDGIMEEFMGIEEYVKMVKLPYDGIHHIDMHMKLLDESTLLVGEYPEGIADGPQIEANIQYVISQFKTRTGRDYKVIRIPMPPDQFGRYPDDNGFYRTYANAMFVNKTILVPTYEERYDTTALRIWQEAMPGYKIVGIDCNAIIPAGGAIHCITKEIGAEAPLLITHVQPPVDADDESLILTATAKHRTGVEGMSVSVRRAGEDFMEVALVPGDEDRWEVTLDMFEPGDSIQYFFTASSVDGKQRTRPLVAPEGFYTLRLPEVTTAVYDVTTSIYRFSQIRQVALPLWTWEMHTMYVRS